MIDLNMIDLKNETPKNQKLEVWSGKYNGYVVEIYQKRILLSRIPKWYYRLKRDNFIYDSYSENEYGYQEKVSASGAAYQHICKL